MMGQKGHKKKRGNLLVNEGNEGCNDGYGMSLITNIILGWLCLFKNVLCFVSFVFLFLQTI